MRRGTRYPIFIRENCRRGVGANGPFALWLRLLAETRICGNGLTALTLETRVGRNADLIERLPGQWGYTYARTASMRPGKRTRRKPISGRGGRPGTLLPCLESR